MSIFGNIKVPGWFGPVVPSTLLTTWYNALTVKPSQNLLNALNQFANGMYADGNWALADFIALFGGMETMEQQLLPLKTTSNTPISDLSGTPASFSAAGLVGNPTNTVHYDSEWNPVFNGQQFASAAYMGIYTGSKGNDSFYAGSTGTVDNDYATSIKKSGTDYEANINSGADAPITTTILNVSGVAYLVIRVDPAGPDRYFIQNGNEVQDIPTGNQANTDNFYILWANDASGGDKGTDSSSAIIRAMLMGEGVTTNQAQVKQRLDTFFIQRGLPVFTE